MKTSVNRRDWMKAAAAGVAAGAWSTFGGRSAGAAEAAEAAGASESEIKIAGYNYDRVRAIVYGQVGLPDHKVAFDFQDIYRANQSAFGPERKYEVTELGLIPYVTKFICSVVAAMR